MRAYPRAAAFLNSEKEIAPEPPTQPLDAQTAHPELPTDLLDVKGQEHVKRAIEVAAAGGHNLIMIGPPGSGKTMIAKRIPSILPRLSIDESLETTKIQSITGLLPSDTPLVVTRPYRSPHHTISDAGLIGGGKCTAPWGGKSCT